MTFQRIASGLRSLLPRSNAAPAEPARHRSLHAGRAAGPLCARPHTDSDRQARLAGRTLMERHAQAANPRLAAAVGHRTATRLTANSMERFGRDLPRPNWLAAVRRVVSTAADQLHAGKISDQHFDSELRNLTRGLMANASLQDQLPDLLPELFDLVERAQHPHGLIAAVRCMAPRLGKPLLASAAQHLRHAHLSSKTTVAMKEVLTNAAKRQPVQPRALAILSGQQVAVTDEGLKLQIKAEHDDSPADWAALLQDGVQLLAHEPDQCAAGIQQFVRCMLKARPQAMAFDDALRTGLDLVRHALYNTDAADPVQFMLGFQNAVLGCVETLACDQHEHANAPGQPSLLDVSAQTLGKMDRLRAATGLNEPAPEPLWA